MHQTSVITTTKDSQNISLSRELDILSNPKSTFLSSVLSSQVISNVPSAMLLSGFTSHFKELLLGVNIGGMGTLIASLASVISYKIYTSSTNHSKQN